ncbi:hypothetical protein [Aquabacterium sp.]|uniref:hypothetical protein n=1 Tax=Aquabacterium sp. TaxID=1872578 RepID=UPI002C4C0F21|nr:hypothetical protein [Aquabacterium sp.]HSW03796.1 hypothetical protein [Aquabacterium sp.]
MVAILGDRATAVPWTEELQGRWQHHMEQPSTLGMVDEVARARRDGFVGTGPAEAPAAVPVATAIRQRDEPNRHFVHRNRGRADEGLGERPECGDWQAEGLEGVKTIFSFLKAGEKVAALVEPVGAKLAGAAVSVGDFALDRLAPHSSEDAALPIASLLLDAQRELSLTTSGDRRRSETHPASPQESGQSGVVTSATVRASRRLAQVLPCGTGQCG